MADRQVATAAGNLRVQGQPVLVRKALQRKQAGGAQCVIECRVLVLAEDIEVLAKSATEQLRLWRNDLVRRCAGKSLRDAYHLWNDRDVRAQSIEVDGVRWQTVEVDLALGVDATQ